MSKLQAVIVDIDGTLALKGAREPFDYARVGEDAPNPPVVWLVDCLAGEVSIILVSGREDTCRAATMAWLARASIEYRALYMRPAGDYRQDAVLKEEIYRRDIEPEFAVRLVLDDRDQTVAMWRRLGLTCLQVAEGNF